MNGNYVGFDIGGTKCAVVVGTLAGDQPRIVSRFVFPTPETQEKAMDQFVSTAKRLCAQLSISGIGICAGNPMDAGRGMLRNPPNLPGWCDVSLTDWASRALGAPAKMENDANACALAEWKWGAGKGCQNMVFLTFGTGFGAGLILNGQLYRGTCGNGGELGHWRMSEFGPSGYGKPGSWEGYCSGGGIRQLACIINASQKQTGMESIYGKAEDFSAKAVAQAAAAGDAAALAVFETSGTILGRGLAQLIDLLNPERIVIGSIFARCEELLSPPMKKVLRQETLEDSLDACRIVPAKLGEQIGDYAAVATAMQARSQLDTERAQAD